MVKKTTKKTKMFHHYKKLNFKPYSNLHELHDHMLNMSPQQHALFDEVVQRKVTGQKNHAFYPHKFPEFNVSRDDVLKSRIHLHTQSPHHLAKFVRTHAKGGNLASSIAQKAWNIASKTGKAIVKYGKIGAKWVAENPESVSKIVDIIKTGVDIAKSFGGSDEKEQKKQDNEKIDDFDLLDDTTDDDDPAKEEVGGGLKKIKRKLQPVRIVRSKSVKFMLWFLNTFTKWP